MLTVELTPQSAFQRELAPVPEKSELEAALETRPEVYAFLVQDAVYRPESIDTLIAQLTLNNEFALDAESRSDLESIRTVLAHLSFDPTRSIAEQVQERGMVETTPPVTTELTRLAECYEDVAVQEIDGSQFLSVRYSSNSWSHVSHIEAANPELLAHIERYLRVKYWHDTGYRSQDKSVLKELTPVQAAMVGDMLAQYNMRDQDQRRELAYRIGMDNLLVPGAVIADFDHGWCSTGESLIIPAVKFARETGGLAILHNNEGMGGNELSREQKIRLGIPLKESSVERYALQKVIERERDGYVGNSNRTGQESVSHTNVSWSKGAITEKVARAIEIGKIAKHLGKEYPKDTLTLGDVYSFLGDTKSILLATAEADSCYFLSALPDAAWQSWMYSILSGKSVDVGLWLNNHVLRNPLVQKSAVKNIADYAIKFYADSVLAAKSWLTRLKNPYASAFDRRVKPEVAQVSAHCAYMFGKYPETVRNSKNGLLSFEGLTDEQRHYLSFAGYTSIFGTGDLLTEFNTLVRAQEEDDRTRPTADNGRTVSIIKKAGHALQAEMADFPLGAYAHLHPVRLMALNDFARSVALIFTGAELSEDELRFIDQQRIRAVEQNESPQPQKAAINRLISNEAGDSLRIILSSVNNFREIAVTDPQRGEELLEVVISMAQSHIGARNGSRKAVDQLMRYYASQRIATMKMAA